MIILSRKDLQPMRLYFEHSSEQYFWSPDGVGGYWYDTLEEALEDVGLEPTVTVYHVQKIED